MHWLKLLKNNLNQQLFKSKHLQVSYLEDPNSKIKPNGFVSLAQQVGQICARCDGLDVPKIDYDDDYDPLTQ